MFYIQLFGNNPDCFLSRTGAAMPTLQDAARTTHADATCSGQTAGLMSQSRLCKTFHTSCTTKYYVNIAKLE